MNIIFLSGMTFAMWIFLMAMSVYGVFWLICFACFIGGCVSIPLIGVMICYATELTTIEFVPICTCLSFFAESLCSILIGFYFMYFKDACTFYLIISSLLTIFLVVYVMYAKETPHFLFKIRKYQECLDHLKLMAHYNNYMGDDLPTVE